MKQDLLYGHKNSILGFNTPFQSALLSYSNPSLNRGVSISKSQLKAYYTFEEASGNLLNKASAVGSVDSFASEDMVNTGVAYQQTGKISFGYVYDGVNDKSVGNSVSNWKLLSNANDFSFSIWIKYTGSWANDNVWMASCNSSANQGMIFDARDTGDVRFVSQRGGVSDFNDSWNTNLSDANWHHYVIRYDNTAHEIELWLDGVNQGTKACTLVGTGNPDVVLQLMDTDYGGAADGTVDEFAVFARKITNAEIAAFYNGGNGVSL